MNYRLMPFPGLLVAALMASSAAQADEGCDPDLSSPRECWHSCKTEDDITICDIIWCPEGINCSGVPWDSEAQRFELTAPAPDPAEPRVGDSLSHYADGRRVRGRVTTRLYRPLTVDSLSESELLILVTPRLDPPTKDTE